MNLQELQAFIDKKWDQEIIPQLKKYIEIPNKSPLFDAQWQEHGYMQQAVDLIKNWCLAQDVQGLQLEVIEAPHRTPLIMIDIPGQVDDTVLLYGHLDKQPEMSGWDPDLAPWKAVLKGDRLYGRGGADDGYAAFASLSAIKALQEQNIPHARCIILIEASEESGSIDLPYYVDLLAPRIGQPSLVVCLDSGCGNYEQLWSTTSLRGIVNGNLSVELLKEGVHSGYGSGIYASSFRVLTQLIKRIEDETTGEIKLSAAKTTIPAERIEQAKQAAASLQDSIYTEIQTHGGVEPMSKDNVELLLNRSWRAQLSITGVEGLPSLENAGNVLRPKTAVKLSLRLPPLCDAEKVIAAMKHTLEDNPPYHAKVEFHPEQGANGWNAPAVESWLNNASIEASMHFFGKPVAYMGEGGSIPFMGMLGKRFPKAQFLITGVLGPQSNAHGPNEFLHIPMGKKLTCCVAYVIAKHATKNKIN